MTTEEMEREDASLRRTRGRIKADVRAAQFPRLLDDPEYVELLANLGKLKGRLRELQDRVSLMAIEGHVADDATALVKGMDHLGAQHRRGAHAVHPDGAVREYVSRGQFDTVNREIDTLRRAIPLQEEALDKVRSAVSKRICEDNRGRYAAMVRTIIEAGRALAVAATAEQEFREAIFTGDISFSLPVMNVTGVWNTLEDHGAFARYVKEAREGGLIGPDEYRNAEGGAA